MSTHYPSQDAYIRGDSPTMNNGSGTTLLLGRRSSTPWRALMLFDLSSLNLDDGIISADLALQATAIVGTPTTTLKIHRIQDNSLDDGAGVFFTQAGVTYNSRDGTNNWSVAGGDFIASPGASVAWPVATGSFSVDVRDLLEDALRLRSRWLALLLKKDVDDSGTSDYISIGSTENGTTAFRPTLTVVVNSDPVRKQVINLS